MPRTGLQCLHWTYWMLRMKEDHWGSRRGGARRGKKKKMSPSSQPAGTGTPGNEQLTLFQPWSTCLSSPNHCRVLGWWRLSVETGSGTSTLFLRFMFKGSLFRWNIGNIISWVIQVQVVLLEPQMYRQICPCQRAAFPRHGEVGLLL